MAVTDYFPDPDSEGAPTSVDGWIRRAGADESWASIITGAGVTANDDGATIVLGLRGSTTNNQYSTNYRTFYLFDTSEGLGTDTINSADFDLYYTSGHLNQLSGEDSANSATVVVETSPASDTALAASDYQNGHVTAHGTELGRGGTQASLTDNSYGDTIALNASGLAEIDPAGITRLGCCSGWDIDSTTTGLTWTSNGWQYVIVSSADEAGTTQDPRLRVTHAAAAAGGPPVGTLSMMGVGI